MTSPAASPFPADSANASASADASTGGSSSAPAWIAIVLLCLAAYLPGFFTLPPVDRDESRFAQASRQMFEAAVLPADQRTPALHAGGLAVPMLKDRPRLNKPPAIYWLQGASAATFTLGDPRRDAIWMYRVPSLLAAIAAVLITWHLGASMFGPAVGRLAAISLAVAPVVAWEAHQARADMVLLAFTLLAMRALWEFVPRTPPTALAPGAPVHASPARPAVRAWAWPLVLWLAVAAGILTKGPITPMVVAFAAVGTSLALRRWRWLLDLRPALGLLILVTCIAPWVYAVASHIGFEQYLAIIHDEVLGRSLEPKEGHWGPPGYHLVLLPIIAWPAAMLAGVGVVLALRNASAAQPAEPRPSWPARVFRRLSPGPAANPALVFTLAWLLPAWIVFELVSTKLPHYTMPLLPAVALLGARAVLHADAGLVPDVRDRLVRLGLGLWLGIGAAFALGTLALLAILWLDPAHAGSRPVLGTLVSIPAAIVALVLVDQSRRALREGRHERAQSAAVLAMLPLLMALVQFILPQHAGLSRRVAASLREADPAAARPMAMVRYHEDSMVFLTRARIRRVDEGDLPALASARPEMLLVAPAELAQRLGLPALAEVRGFNYSLGRAEHLVITELASFDPARAAQSPMPVAAPPPEPAR